MGGGVTARSRCGAFVPCCAAPRDKRLAPAPPPSTLLCASCIASSSTAPIEGRGPLACEGARLRFPLADLLLLLAPVGCDVPRDSCEPFCRLNAARFLGGILPRTTTERQVNGEVNFAAEWTHAVSDSAGVGGIAAHVYDLIEAAHAKTD